MNSIKADIGSYQIDLNSFVKEGSTNKDINDFDKLIDKDGNHLFIWTYDSVPYYPMPYIMETVPRMSNFPTRKNDVFICAYPASGTHWFWEMVCMLFNKKAEYLTGTKEQDMMEFLLPEIFEKRPSPRVLNTHLRPKYLPEKMVKEGKIILIVRNPKDVVVSNYRQTHGLKVLGYEGSFPSFYEMFLEGKIHYGSWFDYINDWMEVKEINPNLIVVSYEEAKKDLPSLISRLSKYLDLEHDEDLFKKIAELCSFNSMKANKESAIGQLDIWKKDSGFFRSGKAGTWKNWLTVEQNERMDESLEIKLKSSEISEMYRTS